MRKRTFKTLAFPVLFFGSMFSASAQTGFKYEAPLNKVDSTGFYKINLGPDVIGKSNADLSDIRLTDAKGNFVPYVTEGYLPEVEKLKFIGFTEVSAKTPADTGTSFVVENITKRPVCTLWVKLQNTAVSRTVNISGSDDLKNWYAIEENVPLEEAVLNSDGTYFQLLSFPASSYRYLKLLVNDKNKTPIKFLEAGNYLAKQNPVFYWPVPIDSVSKKESHNTTVVTIRLKGDYQVDFLHLSVSAPKYFKRNTSLLSIDKTGGHFISGADLSPLQKGDIFLSTRANKLELRIDNGDNLPLTIDSIKVYQANHYVVSYLEKGQQYRIFTGDTAAKAPEYDLKFFADSIRGVRELNTGPVMKNNNYAGQTAAKQNNRPYIIWGAIITALLLLSLLTWKMLAEMGKKV